MVIDRYFPKPQHVRGGSSCISPVISSRHRQFMHLGRLVTCWPSPTHMVDHFLLLIRSPASRTRAFADTSVCAFVLSICYLVLMNLASLSARAFEMGSRYLWLHRLAVGVHRRLSLTSTVKLLLFLPVALPDSHRRPRARSRESGSHVLCSSGSGFASMWP